ncbi:hypothetical protein FS749_005206 [Ceratobasidium sp. UAMH 11750]|nr:hypothetical protein FS749_005206 [Ceratobasidium sp. UAMH 11750]
MIAKLKRGLHRARDTVRHPFRHNNRKNLDFHDFHIEWDGLKSFSWVLDNSSYAPGSFKSTVDELWRCIEVFESNQRNANIQSREEYEKLGVEINDLFRALSKFFDGTSTPPSNERVAQLACNIKNEINAVRRRQPEVERDAERGVDVRGALMCYRRVRILLGRFVVRLIKSSRCTHLI